MAAIAYLGPQGTFTDAAVQRLIAADRIPHRGAAPRPVPAETAPAALAAVRAGDADFACVPIESSIDGSVTPTLDALAIGTPLQIFAETTLDVAFSIAAAPGVDAATAATVAAHPVAAAQVRRWLAAEMPQARILPANSNAAAAEQVADGKADAAVCTALAAARHHLVTLADGVIDEATARTRFVLVGPPGPPPPRTGTDRTAVILRLVNVPGALVAALAEFADRGIDLSRIESRPTRTELGTYRFFLDCAGHVDDAGVADALAALQTDTARCAELRYLGSWPLGEPDGGARR